MRILAIAVAALVLALSVNTTRAEERQDSSLAFELSAMREAWLYGDDQTAAARLDALIGDNRLTGDFPRWFSALRAVLALENGDTEKALSVVAPVLKESKDARNYLRTARLFLAYGAPEAALKLIREGRVRAPDSRALMRFEAGLQWLQGDYDGALATYMLVLTSDEQALYPYVRPANARWSQVRPWGETGDKPVKPAADEDEEDWGWEEPTGTGEYQPEPFADLFKPIYWYPSDLPGLDRLLEKLARDPAQLAARGADFEARLKTATETQEKVDNLRSGDQQTRKQLEDAARTARFEVGITARIAAIGRLNAGEYEACEKIAAQTLAVTPEDVALLDLQAHAMGKLGRAEEARTGPLARLRGSGYVAIYATSIYIRGPYRQMVDRVFEPALTLYHANPEAGLIQLEQMRNTFGDTARGQPVSAAAIGLWLYQRGEHALAQRYLLEASRLNGYESGRPIYQEAVFVESALIAIGEAAAKPDDKDAPKEVAPAQPEDEVDPLEMAKLDANTHPLLRKSLRAGAIMGSIPDARIILRTMAEVDSYTSVSGIAPVRAAARFMPEGEKVMADMLWGLPAKIASDVPNAELDAFLADTHATSVSLKSALDGMAELVGQARSNQSWEVRRSLGQKTGPVLGLIEARAIVLRGKLLKDKPATLADLAAWLAEYQQQIDLRAALQSRPAENTVRFREARTAAGIPEVAHRGLLLDGARVLARAGAHADAARLLWFNRDAAQGLESQNHLLSLASVLARKGGDTTLQSRCLLEAVQQAPDPRSREMVNPQLLIVEVPDVRADLLEFGELADLLQYAENQLVPNADTPDMTTLERAIPELLQARPTLIMRNTSRAGMDGIFSTSMSAGSCTVILRNWYKMMVSADSYASCSRFAAWVIASDLPVTGRVQHNGLCAPQDSIAAWAMLRELYRKQGANDPRALAGLDRMDKLLAETDTIIDVQDYARDDWWE